MEEDKQSVQRNLALAFSPDSEGPEMLIKNRQMIIRVSHDEYLLYSTFFSISDIADCRSMSMSVFSALLQFTTIPETTRTAFVEYISRENAIFSVPLELEDWILACKFIERLQRGIALEEVLESFIQPQTFPSFADFWFRGTKGSVSVCVITPSVAVESVGWELLKQGMETFYAFKFKCTTTSPLFSRTQWTFTRRFSDFDFFCKSVLRKAFVGAVLPPIPPKYFTVDEKIASQRAKELAMFLDDALCCPRLSSSFELRAFLEASPSGLMPFFTFYERYYDQFCDVMGHHKCLVSCRIESEDNSDLSLSPSSPSPYSMDNCVSSPQHNNVHSIGGNNNRTSSDSVPSIALSTNSSWKEEATSMARSVVNVAWSSVNLGVDAISKVAPQISRHISNSLDANISLVELSRLQAQDVDDHRTPVEQMKKRRELAICALSRIDKMAKVSRSCEDLIDNERKLIESCSELATCFLEISLLEGSSSLGHISHSFDALTFEKFMHKHTKTLKHSLHKQYHLIFSQIKQISRYRDSVKSAVSQRDDFQIRSIQRAKDLKTAQSLAEKSKAVAKCTADTFAEQQKSPHKTKNYANDVLKSEEKHLLTTSSTSNNVVNQPNPVGAPVVQSSESILVSSYSIVSSLYSAAQSLQDQLIQKASAMTSSMSSSNALLTPNDVFQAQLASSKAIKDLHVAEDALQTCRTELIEVAERFESDLERLNYVHINDLYGRLVELGKLQIVASRESFKLWNSFAEQLDSAMGEDSLLLPHADYGGNGGVLGPLPVAIGGLGVRNAGASYSNSFNSENDSTEESL